MQYSLRRIAAPLRATAPKVRPRNWLYHSSIVTAGLAVTLLQATFLLAPGLSNRSPLVSNLAQIVLGLLAVLSSVEATRHSSRFARRVWWRAALAMALYSIGQAILTYRIAAHQYPGTFLTDLLFFFWMLPLLAAAVIDSPERPDGVDWAGIMDFVQLALCAIALHLFVFGDVARWQSETDQMFFLKWKVRALRDLIVLACLFGREFVSTHRQVRSLFARLGSFYLVYTLADAVYLYGEASRHLRPGTAMDLWWSVPRLALVMLALTWNSSTQEVEFRRECNWRLRCVVLYWAPVFMPLMILGLGASAQSSAPEPWAILVVMSFAVAGTRLLITQFRQEQALAEVIAGKNLLHSVIEGISDAIYLKDSSGRYQLINSAGARYLGLQVDEVVGKSDADLFSPESAECIRRQDQETLRLGRPVSLEETLNAAGKTRTFLSTRNPYRDPQGRVGGVLGVAVDVTPRREMEEQLRRAQRMESIGTFSGGIAHDFNNLLTVIKGYSQLALTESGTPYGAIREYFEQIHKATGRASALITQLLAFSRQQILQPRVISLNQTVYGFQAMLARLIGEDIQVDTRFASDLAAVKADPGQIEQILMNLASNSRDAMPAGGTLVIETANVPVRENLTCSSFIVPAGDYVMLRVHDTGAGMDAQTQARIFEPFFTTKPPGKGTGLGLATVYGIVKQSGGHITVESYPRTGTTFSIYLPRVSEPVEPVIHNSLQPIRRVAGHTVLVVDDDHQVCHLAATILSRAGFKVLQASSPLDAERIACSHRDEIDVLLTNVVMSGGGGREAARRVQGSGCEARVLYMSGHTRDVIAHHGIPAGNAAFLAKPFSPDILIQRVNELLTEEPHDPALNAV